MALRMSASSTANALKLSSFVSKSHLSLAFSISRCFSTVLEGLKYANSHEWVKPLNMMALFAIIGITDHAQDHLGEVVFVELPEENGWVSKEKSFGEVESVKATSEILSPSQVKSLRLTRSSQNHEEISSTQAPMKMVG